MSKKKNRLVVYTSHDEFIITTKKKEDKTIQDFFTNTDRDIDDYDREEFNESFVVSPELRLRWES